MEAGDERVQKVIKEGIEYHRKQKEHHEMVGALLTIFLIVFITVMGYIYSIKLEKLFP